MIWYGKCAYNERNDLNIKHSLFVSLKTAKIERVRRSIVSEHIWYISRIFQTLDSIFFLSLGLTLCSFPNNGVATFALRKGLHSVAHWSVNTHRVSDEMDISGDDTNCYRAERAGGQFHWKASNLVPRVLILLDQPSEDQTCDPPAIRFEFRKYRIFGLNCHVRVAS